MIDTRFIDNQRRRIDYLLSNVPQDSSGSLELQAHWAHYTCVVMSGFIEGAIKGLLAAYTNERTPQLVANYVSSKLDQFQSAKSENILAVLHLFSQLWEAEMRAFLTEERKGAINSVITNRHKIAHGKGQDSTVTIHQLKQWYPHINDSVNYLIKILEKA